MTLPVIRPVSPHDAGALRLLRASDEYMAALYPAESNHLEPADALAMPHVRFYGLFADGRLAGCGAFKHMEDDGIYGEVKRVFVDPPFRGRGFAKIIVQHVEAQAAQDRLPLLRLETGISQHEALALYLGLGYRLRGPFGAYRPDPLSLFMEKNLQEDR